ncbi:MAG: helix-turn-helix domain-containing protein [Hyphomonadaceae bacterium]|nr:helix-turn-helix domain-containing protein [Hyphomonadaceae bacterium]
MYEVTVVLMDDGYASTAIAPIEIFHSAGALYALLKGGKPDPQFRVTTVSVTGKPVMSPYGVGLTPTKAMQEIKQTDVVIVPTSGLELDGKLVENSAISPWLRDLHAGGAYVAGVCMGAAYLAQAGLLDGRAGTTHWALVSEFERRWPKVKWRGDLMVTEEQRVLCSGGVCASMDVSLYLVEKLCGHEVAVQTAKSLNFHMPRVHQSGYAVLPLSPPHEDARIRTIEHHLQTHYREAISTEALAERVSMSARTFMRRFKAATGRLPGAYLQAVRIETAKAMLERENTPVSSVASAVGYEDVSFFRALFKRSTGMTPAEYRTRFGALAVRGIEGVDISKV